MGATAREAKQMFNPAIRAKTRVPSHGHSLREEEVNSGSEVVSCRDDMKGGEALAFKAKARVRRAEFLSPY